VVHRDRHGRIYHIQRHADPKPDRDKKQLLSLAPTSARPMRSQPFYQALDVRAGNFKKLRIEARQLSTMGLPDHNQIVRQELALVAEDLIEVADEVLHALEPQLGWNPHTQGLVANRVHQDPTGQRHVRYRQQINGIPVYAADTLVHLRANNGTYDFLSASFSVLADSLVNIVPLLTRTQAETRATGLWQADRGTDREPEIAHATLMVYAPSLVHDPADPSVYLIWRVVTGSEVLNSFFSYYIDAHNGALHWKNNEVGHIDVQVCDMGFEPAAALPWGDPTRPLYYTSEFGRWGCEYDMANDPDDGVYPVPDYDSVLTYTDDETGEPVTCWWGRDSRYPGGFHQICSPTPRYLPPHVEPGPFPGYPQYFYYPPGDYHDTLNVFGYIQKSYSYLNNALGQNGPDGYGGMGGYSVSAPNRHYPYGSNTAYTFVEMYHSSWQDSCPNAFAYQTRIVFCGGTGTVDITGHEYAHTIAAHMHMSGDNVEGFSYSGETGALEESYCDLFGEAVEASVIGSNDWMVGGNLSSAHPDVIGGGFRNLQDPGNIDFSYFDWVPDWYNYYTPEDSQSEDFYCGTSDNGGVHRNSHVPSYAMYLLSEGGSHNDCAVQGIGLGKVMEIFHLAMSQYFTKTETFNGAYVKLQEACRAIYCDSVDDAGCQPHECQQLKIALQAVKMDLPSKCAGGNGPATCAQPACALDGKSPVNENDLHLLAANWLSAGTGDLDGSGKVDMTDISALANYWLSDCVPESSAQSQASVQGLSRSAAPSPAWLAAKADTLELFVMSLCPYAQQAEAAVLSRLLSLASEQRPKLKIRYLFGRRHVNGVSRYVAMHGEPEVTENLVQMLIRDVYAQVFAEYLQARVGSQASWQAIALECGLRGADIDFIAQTIAEGRDQLIAEEYENILAEYGTINRSPTFFWQGRSVRDIRQVGGFEELDLSAGSAGAGCGKPGTQI